MPVSPAIRMIASLKRSIWDANPHPFLISFRQNFLQHYAAFWSNGHQIERDVKEAGYCDNTKRSEEVTSIYSICRSSHRTSIKVLLTTSAQPAKRAMLTPLVEGKVQFGMLVQSKVEFRRLKRTDHFDLIKEELYTALYFCLNCSLYSSLCLVCLIRILRHLNPTTRHNAG